MKRAVVFASILCIAALVLSLQLLPNLSANDGGSYFKIFDRDSVAYGRTYADWNVGWEQWAYSIPVANHPLFDHGDCSVGQSGPVWFLGGKFCANNDPTCGATNVVRSCRVPYDKALYVNVVSNEDSAIEDPANAQIAALRAYSASQIDGATNVEMDVDGQRIPYLKDRFRTTSNAFGFSLPDDNYLKAVYPPGYANFDAGTYFPAEDDGVFVMLAPLPIGKHLIHFHGEFPAWNFVLDITYHIYVYR